MPLFDFRAAATAAVPSTESDAARKRRRRAFDFGDDDDELDELVFEAPAPKDANGSMAATTPHILAPALSSFGTEGSITPESQRSHTSRAQSQPTFNNHVPLHSAFSFQGKVFAQEPALSSFGTEGSITPESQRSHTSRPPSQSRLNNHEPLQHSAVSLQNKLFAPAPSSIVDGIWGKSGQGSKDRVPERSGEALKRQLGKVDRSCDVGMTLNRCQPDNIDKRTVPSQSSMVNNCGYSQDAMLGAEQNHHSQHDRAPQGGGARDAWKEIGRHGGREASGITSADDHARHVLLSPLETSRLGLNSHISARSSGIDYIEDVEQDAREKGGLSRQSNFLDSNALVPNKFFADDGPRPCVPGPAGTLGRVEVGADRSGGLSSPALQEQRDQDQNASREMREGAGGIAVDATGPQLPLRRTFLVVF